MVQGQSLFLAENRDFVQKVLDQPKGAQPPADKAPQQTARQEEKSQHGERYLETLLVQQGLQRP